MRRALRPVSRWNVAGAAVLVGLVVLWEILVATGILSFQYLPAPSSVGRSLVELGAQGELIADLLHTVLVVLQAWVIAVVIGTTLGVVIAQLPWARTLTGTTIDILRSLPVVAFVPVVLMIFGPTREAEVIVAAYAATWPMIINVSGGVRQITPRLHDVATTFQLSRWAKARKILLPAALPAVLVGARLSLGLSLVVTIVAEMIGNPDGLGYGMVRWQFALRPEAMWAYLVVIAGLGLTLNSVLVGASRALPSGSAARS